MKKHLLLCGCLISIGAFSQPAIQNGANLPSPGYTVPVSMATPTNLGSAGANQTWNFSALTFTALGNLSVITPSSSSMSGSFPSANYAYTFAGTTSFFQSGILEMEVQAYSITSPGTGNDYSPNPRTVLKYPFVYQDTVNDTWQKVGGSVNTVTLTYDGYGTLITPSATYTNVVRVKEDYGSGGIDYQWYLTNPLMSIMVYDHNNNLLYYTAPVLTGITDQYDVADVNVYPSPATDIITFDFQGIEKSNVVKVSIMNTLGQTVVETQISSDNASIDVSRLSPGVYYYQLVSEDKRMRRGKLVVE